MPVSGTSNLPIAPRNTKWDAAAAKRRVFEACGGNVACISRAFLYRSEGDARSPDVWSMGFADFIDGKLHIIPKAIAACAGKRGIGTFRGQDGEAELIRARITTIYDKVRGTYPDWPLSPFALVAAICADADGKGFEGPIAFEGVATGDGRFIADGALTWDEGPWPLVFDRSEMDHSGATIGTINAIERREGGAIWGVGNLSDSDDPDVASMVGRASELLAEGAVGVSISVDDSDSEMVDEKGNVIDPSSEDEIDWSKVITRVTAARIRSVAIVDEAAFSGAKLALVAAADPKWFSNPNFGNGSLSHREDGGDERLVWQPAEQNGEEEQFGCPLTVTEEGWVFGHAALWGRCHVGHSRTCVRPPKEPAAYRGFLTGERVPGIPTGPLVMKTTHASLKLDATAASAHYDHTGYAVADVTIGSDPYGIWVSGALRPDATPDDIEILRGSALSGDWRDFGGRHRLVGLLCVSAPGFRISRALAASGTIIASGPGCTQCDDEVSMEDRLAELERIVASLSA